MERGVPLAAVCAALRSGAAVCAALCLTSTPASARSEAEVGYTRAQTFSAALRYLRVDLAYEVTEQDPDAAYLLFRVASPDGRGETSRGSIEVVQRERSVRVMVNLPKLPGYHEDVLKQGLLNKLRREYGDPPPRRPRTEDDDREKPPEAGSDEE